MNKLIIPEQYWANLPFSVFSSIFYEKEKFLSHTHSYYEFFLVAEGELIQIKNGETANLPRRSLCFLNPDDQHELQNSQKSDHVQIINCTFSKKLFNDTIKVIKKDLPNPPDNWSRTLMNISDRTWQGLINKANFLQFERHSYPVPSQQAYFRSLLFDVLCLLAEPEKSMSAEVPGWLIKVREDMETDDNFIAGLNRFVKLSGKTQEHLNRSMKKHYKETPTAFINQLRCKKAAKLLLYSRHDIWTVMSECGFKNYPYFLKCFRKSFGLSPKQYVQVNRRAFTLK